MNLKIKLVILDSDQRYLQKVVDAITVQYADSYELFVFTNLDAAMECVQSKKVNVFLAAEEFDVPVREIPERCAFSYLVETSGFSQVKNENAIGKYQKLAAICKEIELLYSNSLEEGRKFGTEGQARLLLFTSPAGGVGTTTMAVAYAIQQARRGEGVLYVNLEHTGDTSLYFAGDGRYTFDNVLYELQSNKKNMQYQVMHMTQESAEGVSFIQSPKYAATFGDMTQEQLVMLLDMLTKQSEYKQVVLTVDYQISSAFAEMMRCIDRVVMVTDGSKEGNSKVARALDTLALIDEKGDMLEKIVVAYNRESSKTGEVLTYSGVRQGAHVGRIEGVAPKGLVTMVAERLNMNL